MLSEIVCMLKVVRVLAIRFEFDKMIPDHEETSRLVSFVPFNIKKSIHTKL